MGNGKRVFSRLALFMVSALLMLALAGCKGSSIPSSSIYIVDSDTDQIISTAATTGDIELAVDEVLRFRIERLTTDGEDSDTSDVTTVANYSFVPDGIALANNLGELRGVEQGTTRLEVRFRPSGLDAADRVFLDVTVVP